MPAIASLRSRQLELAWGVFALANFAVMLVLPRWETIPFHFIWVSLTLLYGFRVLAGKATALILGVVMVATGIGIGHDAAVGTQPWDEISEVPLMAAMFLAMVWHAHRRREALRVAKAESAQRHAMLVQQEHFLHDASHELRTPVTIARGHLEVLKRTTQDASPEIDVTLDELERMERILERLLLLAKAERPDFVVVEHVDLEPFLEDVFMRWSEVAPRSWRLGRLASGALVVDPEALRIVLDALLENAVKYTAAGDTIELRALAGADDVVIEVEDEGCGIPHEALSRIFERFARSDAARTRAQGGVGLGLAIVDAIAKAHDGGCTATTSTSGSTFSVRLPRFDPAPPDRSEDRPSARPAVELG